MDAILHSERVSRDGTQCRWGARVSELPDGTIVLVDDASAAFLIQQGYLYLWSPAGYVERGVPGARRSCSTPESAVVFGEPRRRERLLCLYEPTLEIFPHDKLLC